MSCCLCKELFCTTIFKALIPYSRNTSRDKLNENGDFFPSCSLNFYTLRFIELFPSPLLFTMRFNSPRTLIDETLLYIGNFSIRTLKIYSSNRFFIFYSLIPSLWLSLMHAKIYIHMQIFHFHMCIHLRLRFFSMSCNSSK